MKGITMEIIELDGIEHIPVASRLKPQTIENLKQLAEGLLKVEPMSFGMATFTTIEGHVSGIDRPKSIKNECGTCACAAGHAYSMGIGDLNKRTWIKYAFDNFTDGSQLIFEWIFGGQWSHVDDTPVGAAKRILYMLKLGIPNDTHLETPDLGISADCGDLPDDFFMFDAYERFEVEDLR